MPLFEFRCLDCGLQFEKLVHKAGNFSGITCPVCDGRQVEEMLSAFAVPASKATSGSRTARCKPTGG